MQHFCLWHAPPNELWALQKGCLLWSTPGVASAGWTNASQQGANYYHMVFEEDVIAQHERPLQTMQQ